MIEEFLETITRSNCSEGVTDKKVKRLMDLGANKDANELYVINYGSNYYYVILKNCHTCKKVAVYVENYYSKSNT